VESRGLEVEMPQKACFLADRKPQPRTR